MEGAQLFGVCWGVLLAIWVHAVQPTEMLSDELLGIEIHGVTWTALAIGDIGQDGQSVIVGDEEMQPPPAFWVRLQMMKKPMVAVLDQFSANMAAVGINCQTLGTPCLGYFQPVSVCRDGLRQTVLGYGEPDGPKVGQKGGGKGR